MFQKSLPPYVEITYAWHANILTIIYENALAIKSNVYDCLDRELFSHFPIQYHAHSHERVIY